MCTLKNSVASIIAAVIAVGCQTLPSGEPPRASSAGHEGAVQTAPSNLQVAKTTPKRKPVVWSMDKATATEVRTVEEVVGRHLKDPYSAQYENIYALQGSNGHRSLCGTVNAKNAMGGYTGRTAFTILGDKAVFSNDKIFSSWFPSICKPRTVE
jgi:hypothetical protein